MTLTVSDLHAQITDHIDTHEPASCFTVHDVAGAKALPVGTEATTPCGTLIRIEPNETFRDLYYQDGSPGPDYTLPMDSCLFSFDFPLVIENAAILGSFEPTEEPEPEPESFYPYELVQTPYAWGIVLPVDDWTGGMHMLRAFAVTFGLEEQVGIQPVEDRSDGHGRTPFIASTSEVQRIP